MTGSRGRPLEVAGLYFAVLDRLWPANVVCVAELDRVFSPEEVETAWQQLCATSPVARARIVDHDGQLFVVDGPAYVGAVQIDNGSFESAYAEEQRVRLDFAGGPLLRCRYVVADGGSVLILTGHHAVIDGRGGFVLLQRMAGVLAGGSLPEGRQLPPGLEDRIRPGLRWPQDRSDVLELLREMAARRRGAGPVDELLGPTPEVTERRPQLSLHRLDTAETSTLVARAKRIGSTVHGMMASAWLHAAHDLFADGRPTHHLSLATPADMRTRLDPPVPAHVPGMYVAVLTTSHVVGTGGVDTVAQEVSANVRAAVDRGEGELFLALARPGPPDERGAARLRGILAATPQSLAVSNTGTLADGDDPDWLRSVWVGFAPSPNQLAFATATTYRGQLTMTACVDHARLPTEVGERLVAGALRRLRNG